MAEIKLRYFSWVREKTGIDEEIVDIPDGVANVSELITWLQNRSPEFAAAFERADVIRAAMDQTHVAPETPITNAREIAFFPPVTGG